MLGPGRLIFYLKNDHLGDNNLSVPPLAPVPFSRGKPCLDRSRRIEVDCSLRPVFVARNHSSRTSGGVGALLQRAPAFSSPSSHSSAPLDASNQQPSSVICGIPCNENSIIIPTIFFIVSLLGYFTSGAKKEENTREVFLCLSHWRGGSNGSPGESSVGSLGSHRGK